MTAPVDTDLHFSRNLCLTKNQKSFLENRRIDLLEKIAECGSISRAAKAAGMSYKGAWDAIASMNNLAEKPLTVNLTGGRDGGGTFLTDHGKRVVEMFRLIEDEHLRSLQAIEEKFHDFESLYRLLRRMSMRTSAQNALFGVVAAIRLDEIQAEVAVHLKSGQQVVSLITAGSVASLDLTVGKPVYAVIKASTILLSKQNALPLSCRNQLQGQVLEVKSGALMTEVCLDIGHGDTLCATVSSSGLQDLDLRIGDKVCAAIQETNVIIGVE